MVGVVRVGEVENTRLLAVVPVAPAAVNPVMLLNAVMLAVEALVPPLAIGSTPVTPLVNGSPVRLVATPEAGVPSAGVTSVGDVDSTMLPVPVTALLRATPP